MAERAAKRVVDLTNAIAGHDLLVHGVKSIVIHVPHHPVCFRVNATISITISDVSARWSWAANGASTAATVTPIRAKTEASAKKDHRPPFASVVDLRASCAASTSTSANWTRATTEALVSTSTVASSACAHPIRAVIIARTRLWRTNWSSPANIRLHWRSWWASLLPSRSSFSWPSSSSSSSGCGWAGAAIDLSASTSTATAKNWCLWILLVTETCLISNAAPKWVISKWRR